MFRHFLSYAYNLTRKYFTASSYKQLSDSLIRWIKLINIETNNTGMNRHMHSLNVRSPFDDYLLRLSLSCQ